MAEQFGAISTIGNDTQAAIEAGKQLAGLKATIIEGVQHALVPAGMRLESFEHLMPIPARTKQTVELGTPQDFLDYHNRFAGETSTILVDLRKGVFKSILDYHAKDEPGWCTHVASYACRPTPEWEKWTGANGERMTQPEFATFIEDCLPDIRTPAGAEMLEVVTTLEAKKGASFRQGIRLDNGQTQLTYVEEIDGRAGVTGQLSIPQTITLGVRLFEGGEAYEVEARFRYRIDEGRLFMWFDLVRPHLIHEDAVLGVFEQIKEGMTNGHIYRAGL